MSCKLYPKGKEVTTIALGNYLAAGPCPVEKKIVRSVKHIKADDGKLRVKPIYTDGTEGIFVPCKCETTNETTTRQTSPNDSRKVY